MVFKGETYQPKGLSQQYNSQLGAISNLVNANNAMANNIADNDSATGRTLANTLLQEYLERGTEFGKEKQKQDYMLKLLGELNFSGTPSDITIAEQPQPTSTYTFTPPPTQTPTLANGSILGANGGEMFPGLRTDEQFSPTTQNGMTMNGSGLQGQPLTITPERQASLNAFTGSQGDMLAAPEPTRLSGGLAAQPQTGMKSGLAEKLAAYALAGGEGASAAITALVQAGKLPKAEADLIKAQVDARVAQKTEGAQISKAIDEADIKGFEKVVKRGEATPLMRREIERNSKVVVNAMTGTVAKQPSLTEKGKYEVLQNDPLLVAQQDSVHEPNGNYNEAGKELLKQMVTSQENMLRSVDLISKLKALDEELKLSFDQKQLLKKGSVALVYGLTPAQKVKAAEMKSIDAQLQSIKLKAASTDNQGRPTDKDFMMIAEGFPSLDSTRELFEANAATKQAETLALLGNRALILGDTDRFNQVAPLYQAVTGRRFRFGETATPIGEIESRLVDTYGNSTPEEVVQPSNQPKSQTQLLPTKVEQVKARASAKKQRDPRLDIIDLDGAL